MWIVRPPQVTESSAPGIRVTPSDAAAAAASAKPSRVSVVGEGQHLDACRRSPTQELGRRQGAV